MKLKQEILIQVKQTIATNNQQVEINCCSIAGILIIIVDKIFLNCYFSIK